MFGSDKHESMSGLGVPPPKRVRKHSGFIPCDPPRGTVYEMAVSKELRGTQMKPSSAHGNAPREVLDIRQAADYLGISSDSLYRYASDGFIPAFKLGNRWRFRRSRLDEWMDRQSGITEHAPAHKVTPMKVKKPVRAVRSVGRRPAAKAS